MTRPYGTSFGEFQEGVMRIWGSFQTFQITPQTHETILHEPKNDLIWISGRFSDCGTQNDDITNGLALSEEGLQINGMGIDFWGFVVPWPLLFLWVFLLLVLITGTLPSRRGLRGISRADSPFLYWIFTLFFIGVVFVFTAGWYWPELLVNALLFFKPRRYAPMH